MSERDLNFELRTDLYPGLSLMSELNPYAKFLDGRPLEAILSATSHEIANKLQMIGAEKSSEPPAPGKWSPAEIVCHLADCEIAFAFRLRQTLAEDHHVLQPFDQEKWAAPYNGIASQGCACSLHGAAQLESQAHREGAARAPPPSPSPIPSAAP